MEVSFAGKIICWAIFQFAMLNNQMVNSSKSHTCLWVKHGYPGQMVTPDLWWLLVAITACLAGSMRKILLPTSGFWLPNKSSVGYPSMFSIFFGAKCLVLLVPDLSVQLHVGPFQPGEKRLNIQNSVIFWTLQIAILDGNVVPASMIILHYIYNHSCSSL
jgi:hypothetical protein